MTFCKLPHSLKRDRSISITWSSGKDHYCDSHVRKVLILPNIFHYISLHHLTHFCMNIFVKSTFFITIIQLPGPSVEEFSTCSHILTCSNTTCLPLGCQNNLLLQQYHSLFAHMESCMISIIVTTRFGMKVFIIITPKRFKMFTIIIIYSIAFLNKIWMMQMKAKKWIV